MRFYVIKEDPAAGAGRIHDVLLICPCVCPAVVLHWPFTLLFVLRRHLPSPDCQRMNRIPKLVAGWRPALQKPTAVHMLRKGVMACVREKDGVSAV